MRKIIYYVASSIDGFIAGYDDDVSGFVPDGNGVEKYFDDIKAYDTVIMGRKTYENGYNYGLTPGQPAYPHMEHILFSSTLKFENQAATVTVSDLSLEALKRLKNDDGSDIYLCGGGQLAGWLLDNDLIDKVKIKLNPLIQGTGIRLFGDSTKNYQLALEDTASYDKGLQIMTYSLIY